MAAQICKYGMAHTHTRMAAVKKLKNKTETHWISVISE